MALYKGSVKLAGIGSGFEPENQGATGQVLTKTSTGYAYDNIPVDSELSLISENSVQNKVITEALQNVGGSSDHLEEKALVGELYTLSDTLFKQLTPKLADCTVDANVGDVAANTEIHIQRQGSKTPSNKLKLKLKAVGSPTTSVVVEVRKGIQVDVSSSEAYWYGDSSNIIATGSLTSSSFSNDYTEVEFTLDANFGGTEGELLDVVVYQSAGSGATVNASNYYVLACDSTQWSEAFSYVKVNGTTRSREKLMPYCVSNGFVQAMLSKYSDQTVPGNYTISYAEQKQYGTSDRIQNLVYDDISFTNEEDIALTVRVVGTWRGNAYRSDTAAYAQGYYKYGNGADTLFISGDVNLTHQSIDFNGTLQPGEKMSIYYKTSKDWKPCSVGRENVSVIVSGIPIYKNLGKKSKPRELKTIGNKASTTIFGVHIDGTRVDHE